jgi:hypothetical protein
MRVPLPAARITTAIDPELIPCPYVFTLVAMCRAAL